MNCQEFFFIIIIYFNNFKATGFLIFFKLIQLITFYSVPTCLLHTPNASDDRFTIFTSIKGASKDRLTYLLDICDRRLAEPVDSPYCMGSL